MKASAPRRIHALTLAGLLALALVPSSSAAFVDTGAVQTTLAATEAETLRFAGIEAGSDFSLGWTTDGALYAWGLNDTGQLGLGDTASRDEPTRVALPAGSVVVSASAGLDGAIALTSAGDVYTWGNASYAPSGASPGLIPALSGEGVVGISAGGYYFLAWTGDGRLFSWGNNGGGRLGRASGAVDLVPGRVTAQSANARFVTSAAAGRHFGTALFEPGTAIAGWGSFYNAQPGVMFAGLPADSTVAGINAGDAFVFAWTADGRLYEAANTAVFSRNNDVPVVAGRRAVVSMPLSGASSFFAWGDDNVLYGWGLNNAGQLGLGDTVDRAVPTPVTLPAGEVVHDVAEGSSHSLVVWEDGALSAAGTNASGQLGTGDTADRNTFSAPLLIQRWPE